MCMVKFSGYQPLLWPLTNICIFNLTLWLLSRDVSWCRLHLHALNMYNPHWIPTPPTFFKCFFIICLFTFFNEFVTKNSLCDFDTWIISWISPGPRPSNRSCLSPWPCACSQILPNMCHLTREFNFQTNTLKDW